MTNVFFDAAHIEFAKANEKEGEIAKLRDDLNPETNKVFTIAHLAVVAKSLGLDVEKFKGRKVVAGGFREMIADNFGTNEAKKPSSSRGMPNSATPSRRLTATAMSATSHRRSVRPSPLLRSPHRRGWWLCLSQKKSGPRRRCWQSPR